MSTRPSSTTATKPFRRLGTAALLAAALLLVTAPAALAVSTPTDYSAAAQYGLNRIEAESAWGQISDPGSPIVIAILDSGVDYTHLDLVNKMLVNAAEQGGTAGVDDDANGYVDDIYGYDTLGNDGDPMDQNGHGTHLAGVAAASGNDGGIVGLAWPSNFKLMAVRCIPDDNPGTQEDIVQGIDYILARKAAGVNIVAINASWGNATIDGAVKAKIEAAGAAGIIWCGSAGNNGTNIDVAGSRHYPASFDSWNIISVASTNEAVPQQRATWSNYGPNDVDLAAAGVSIKGTFPVVLDTFDGLADGYHSATGTSFSVPLVSATVALLAQKYPGDSTRMRIDRVLQSGDAVATFSGLTRTGAALNAYDALVVTATGLRPTTTANVVDGGWYSGTVNVTLTAVDRNSTAGTVTGIGVDYTEYRLGTSGSFVRGTQVNVSGEGSHTVQFYSVDLAGNQESQKSVTFGIEDTAPVTTATGFDDAWHSTPVVITFTANDAGGSGLARTEYNLNGAGWMPVVGGQVTVGADGVHTLAYRSVDNAGNVEAEQSGTLRIDGNPPTTTATKSGTGLWQKAPATVTFEATDPGAGVDYTEYSLDGGAYQRGTKVIISANGIHTLLYRSVDRGGRVEAAKSLTVNVDAVKPALKLNAIRAVTAGKKATVVFKVRDALPNGGTATVTIQVKNLKGKVLKTKTLKNVKVNVNKSYKLPWTLKKGKYTVRITAKDTAGNAQAKAVTRQLTVK